MCIQQWFRIEILGFHLDPARAAAKAEARRQRTMRLRQKALLASREQEAFQKNSLWYQSLFDPLTTGRDLTGRAETEQQRSQERQELLRLRRMKANQGRILRLKALEPRLHRQQHQAAVRLQGVARAVLVVRARSGPGGPSEDGREGGEGRGEWWGGGIEEVGWDAERDREAEIVSEREVLEDNLNRMFEAEVEEEEEESGLA